MQGSSFIPTPSEIANKKAIINIKTPIISVSYILFWRPSTVDRKNDPNEICHYKKHLPELNIRGLSFPLPPRDVKKFEELNPSIAVSVLVYEEHQLVPLYSSPHRNRTHIVHLLLLTDGDSYHYTLIRDMSRLVAGRTKHNGLTHVCPYCLHPFTQQHVLDNHIFNCSIHKPQAVSFPEEADASLYYKSVNKEYPVPYVLYVDFETFLVPSADKDVVRQ